MKNCITIELEQQTPMWHFRPDEQGCCLRATEVKPKLDRFIAEMREKNGKKDGVEPPFNYKMSFEAIGEKKKMPCQEERNDKYRNSKKKNLYPLFFGNVRAEHPKKLVFYPNGIKMRVFSLDTALLDEISGYLNVFFAQTTFGTRQDKGFGAFYPKSKTFDESGACYCFETKNMAKDEYPEMFRYIHYFHKMIRSGINENNNYYKSFMFFYAKSLGQTWDKPVIRYNFQMFNPLYKHLSMKEDNKKLSRYKQRESMREEREKQFEKEKSYRESKYLFRDALGLSGIQSWGSYRTSVSIDCVKGGVGRFKSPILYRPVYVDGKYMIYLYLSKIDGIKTYEKKETVMFRITAECNNKKKTMEDMHVYPDFLLERYFDFIIENCKDETKKIGVFDRERRNENLIKDIVLEIFGKDKESGNINFRKLVKYVGK
ncbi:hypothetical protein [Xylanibacter muris]|uniref:Uncharacterized protein n=1 Tax=Xylanibacter muris TaxID=2736290 RepID=A0ABX2ANN0_9BACT|nr:hypothetical protein [Xylanibacter muris]NPD92735.1 hypothetical protein [Xylanibacter muris]